MANPWLWQNGEKLTAIVNFERGSLLNSHGFVEVRCCQTAREFLAYEFAPSYCCEMQRGPAGMRFIQREIAKTKNFQKILASIVFRVRSGSTEVMHTAFRGGCNEFSKGGSFLAHPLLFTVLSILRRMVMDDNSAACDIQIGFIRFKQVTLLKAVSILCPGVPDNARVVHTEMISLFSCSRLFASVNSSGFNCESG